MTIADNRFFKAVKAHADSMLEFGRDPSPEDPSPLFAGVVNPVVRKAVLSMTVPPPGIRLTDFNWCGNNLMHDIPFLEVLGALSPLARDSRYADAAEAVFAYYGRHCPHPVTGLFPWGEHLQWSFADRKPAACSFAKGFQYLENDHWIIHDHLRFAPAWFWERMWAHHPSAVVRFARGLNCHLMNPETFEHNRHAPFAGVHWNPIPYAGQGKDFARHSGFFIFDCCFAYRKSGDASLLEWSRRKLAWHLSRRLPNGLVRGCVRSKEQDLEGQHDLLALALWDSALVLGTDTPEGREFAGYARDLFDARARALRAETATKPPEAAGPHLWMAGYFRKPRTGVAAGHILMYHYAGLQAYADRTIELARWAARHVPEPPEHLPVMARAYNTFLDLYLTAFDLTGERGFLDAATCVGDWALRDLLRSGLLLGAAHMKLYQLGANCEYHVDPWAQPDVPGLYYSVSGTPILTRSLLRLALKLEGLPDTLGVDTHTR